MSYGPDPRDPALTDLVERWVAGWVIARRFPPADRVGDALRVEVGLPGRRFEFVTADASAADAAASAGTSTSASASFDAASDARASAPAGLTSGTGLASAPDPSSPAGSDSISDAAAVAIQTPGRNWVTVVTTRPDELIAPLRAAGLSVEGDIEWLMWVDLRDQPSRPVPSPYRVEVDRDGDVLVASAFDADGELATSGRMSLTGTDAIADRVLTVPGHRRRGLGAAVMGALVTAALAEGASTGILAASLEGERLYSRLGWHGMARLAVGRTEDS